MNIEISQVATHLVGFLIALFILRKYAWRPILKVLDDRRQKIADEFAHIEAQKEQAEVLLQEYEERLRGIEEEARAKINEAVSAGQKVATEIKAEAQKDARRITARAKAELERDTERARAQLKEDMVGLTLGATERLLREKIDEAANRQIIERFLNEVETA